jgi:hypothetical protein
MAAGAPVGVFVEGESGVGKSALTRQFLESLRAKGGKVVILEGRCHEQERVPYNAFDAVIDALARHVRARGRATREQLLPPGTGRLLKLFPTLGVVEEVAARGHESIHPRAEARADRDGAFAVLRELLRRVAVRRPTVIVLDDVQWADTDSLALLEQLTTGPDAPPLLYIATARRRPDGTSCAARSAMRGDVRGISLGGLAEGDANALLDRLLAQRTHARGGDAPIDRSSVVASTHGHPMFIEEMVRYLALPRADSGAVALDDALFARVTELDEGAKKLLALVAAAGMPVPHAIVAEAARLSPATYAEHVATLRDARLVRVRGDRQEDAIEPYHDRVREAVLARTGDRARASLHGRLGAVFETRGGGAELLFHHFAAAGDGARATRYAEVAAEAAAGALAFERSATLYRNALSFGATDPARKRRLLTALGERLIDAGRAREAAASFVRAAAVVPTDPGERLELERRAAEQFLMGGHLHEGLAATRDVLRAFDLSLPARRLVALARVGWYRLRLARRPLTWTRRSPGDVSPQSAARLDVCWSVGAGLGMVDSVRSMIFVYLGALLALDHGDEARIARALAAAAIADAGLGRRTEASRLHEACLHASASEGSERVLFYGALSGVAHAFFLDNDWERALAGTREAHRLWQSTGRTEGWESDIAEQFACWCLDNSGRFTELRERVPARIRAAQRAGNRFIEVSFRSQFVNLHLLRDRPDEARADVEEAIGSWLEDSGDFGNQEYLALRSLSYIALYAGDLAAAEGLLPQWARYFASLMGRVVFLRQDALMFIGSIALARAIAARTRGDQRAFRSRMREAKRAARDVLGIALPMARGHALHLRAGIHAVEGDGDGAIAALREGLAHAEARRIALDVACLQLRLATLLGAREGHSAAQAEARDLRLVAERWFAAEGAISPARMIAVVLPGWPHPG